MDAALDNSLSSEANRRSLRGPGADEPTAFDSHRVQLLKDLVLTKEMRAAITSGEFALRLRGAERPGLVDYEELCNRLNAFIDRLERQPPQPEVLPQDEAWKAKGELRMTRSRLEERLVEMTCAQCHRAASSEAADGAAAAAPAGAEGRAPASGAPEALATVPSKESRPGGAADPPGPQKPVQRLGKRVPKMLPERSPILLYLREDQTVDIDSALKESCSVTPFSSDLWERLRGKDSHQHDDWNQSPEEPTMVKSLVAEKQATLATAKHELAKAQAMRAKILKAMGTGQKTKGVAPQTKVEETKQLFRWDREITGRRVLVLLANMDLLFELVAEDLETQLRRASIQDWDVMGRQLKLFVFEFSLLDKQMAPYRQFVHEDPEAVRAEGLDSDELRMLEAHIARIADRLGLQVDCIGEEKSFFRPIRHQWSSLRKGIRKVKKVMMFYANGTRLLYQDLQHAMKLLLKVAFLRYTLQPREVQVCWRAAKDLFVLIPFLIILLIPLSPPGHVLVFSLIMKVYPDFFPSPFTERRQNVMRIYDEIKPVSERQKAWA